MDKKEMMVAGVVVVIAVIVGGIVFAPNADAKFTSIDVLNKGDIGQNGTLYVKLTDNEKTSLSDKTLHVKLTNSKGKVVFDESVKTHATGVAIVKLENVSAGDYDLNITFDGDGNYSSSSISQKLKIKGEHIEEQVDNITLIEETLADAQDSDSGSQDQSSYQSSSSNSYSSYSQSSSSSSSYEDTSNNYYDENGHQMLPEYDEDGKEVDPT